jgi:hypothetical protein
MSNPDLLGQIQEGAQVVTNQREPVGRVTKVWQGSDPAGEDLSDAIQESEEAVTYDQVVQSGAVQGTYVEVDMASGGAAYIPIQAVRAIEGDSVVLDVDQVAISASSWHERPPTLGQETAPRAAQPEVATAPSPAAVVTPQQPAMGEQQPHDTGATMTETPVTTTRETTGHREHVEADTDVRVTGHDIRAEQPGGTQRSDR